MAIGITELEHCTMANIRRHQPCSAYAVRQVFARSSTPEWSGSTGAVYPVIDRLVRRGLIEAKPQAGDPRGARSLTITPEGDAVVRDWITGLEPWMAKATPDPIRTRVSHLDHLASDGERIAFLEAAARLTEDMLKELEGVLESLKAVDTVEYLAGRGAVHQLQARRMWLRELIEFYAGAPLLNGGAAQPC